MSKKNIYNSTLLHTDYENMIRDINSGQMSKTTIAQKYLTSVEHLLIICRDMRKLGVFVRRLIQKNRNEQLYIAAKNLREEQSQKKDADVMAGQLQLVINDKTIPQETEPTIEPVTE